MPSNSTAITLADPKQLGKVFFSPQSSLLLAIKQALPNPIIPAESIVRAALSTIAASQSLQRCSAYSVISSITEAAQAGLSLDVNLGQAYLIPFKGTAKLMYGYRGMCELARRSGEVREVVGELRYAKDKFKISLGSRRELIHEPLDAPTSKRGAILGVYGVAAFIDGRQPMFEYLDIEQVDKIKNMVLKRKKSDEPSPWETAYEEMARKTAIRRLAKRMPQSPGLMNLVRVAVRDEYREQPSYVEPHFIDVEPGMEPVAQAAEKEGIEPEPIKEERESKVREKEPAGDSDAIEKNQVRDVYVFMSDSHVESTDLRKALNAVDHKEKLDTLPKSKWKQFWGELGKYKK